MRHISQVQVPATAQIIRGMYAAQTTVLPVGDGTRMDQRSRRCTYVTGKVSGQLSRKFHGSMFSAQHTKGIDQEDHANICSLNRLAHSLRSALRERRGLCLQWHYFLTY